MTTWTLDSERSPNEGETVLLQWSRGGKDRLSIAEWAFDTWHIPFEGCINPIAWMPLPDKYAEAAND